MELREGVARRFVTDALSGPDPLSAVTDPTPEAAQLLPEVQNAIRAARDSAASAMGMAVLINRLLKVADGKSLRGAYAAEAVDSLRAALLFASAGLDTSLKRLVKQGLRDLAARDAGVDAQFQKWAEVQVVDGQTGAVQTKRLVQILLTAGVTPRDSLMSNWVYALTDGSAQSAERVQDLAQALGVTDPTLRKRIAPSAKTPTRLQEAFTARNQIAHELDVTDPDAEVRKPLEKIRRSRAQSSIARWCVELLDVTQLVTNDVARRLAA